MDFHTLARRELQALCKKNKIPANITNLAMADALSALPHVEGLDEIMQLQSPEKLGIGSTITGLTSTRGRKTVTKEPESAQPVSRSCLGSRRRIVEDPVEDETKKDVAETPAARKRAPAAASSRRKKVEESSVQTVYGTRRSVRLAGKMGGLNMDEGAERNEAVKIGCDLSPKFDANAEKECDGDDENKAESGKVLDEKVDMEGVAENATAGDFEIDVQENGKSDVGAILELGSVTSFESDAMIPNKVMRNECKVEDCNEEAKLETTKDVASEALYDINDSLCGKSGEVINENGETVEMKDSDSSSVTTAFHNAESLDSNSTSLDPPIESVDSSSVLELVTNNLSGRSEKPESELSSNEESGQASQDFYAIEQEFASEEEGKADTENSFQIPETDSDNHNLLAESQMVPFEQLESGKAIAVTNLADCGEAMDDSNDSVMASGDDSDDSVIASDDDSEMKAEDESSFAADSDNSMASGIDNTQNSSKLSPLRISSIAEYEVSVPIIAAEENSTMPKIEVGVESLAIPEKAMTPIKQITQAPGETPFSSRAASPLLGHLLHLMQHTPGKSPSEKQGTTLGRVGVPVADNNDKENFGNNDKKENTPYQKMSLRRLTKELKKLQITNNNEKKNDHHNVVIKEQLSKTRPALQALGENRMVVGESEMEN